MKLLSCNECGCVIDQDKALPSNDEEFEKKFYDEEYNIRTEFAQWTGDGFVACVKCPACKEMVETERKLS